MFAQARADTAAWFQALLLMSENAATLAPLAGATGGADISRRGGALDRRRRGEHDRAPLFRQRRRLPPGAGNGGRPGESGRRHHRRRTSPLRGAAAPALPQTRQLGLQDLIGSYNLLVFVGGRAAALQFFGWFPAGSRLDPDLLSDDRILQILRAFFIRVRRMPLHHEKTSQVILCRSSLERHAMHKPSIHPQATS